MRLSILCVTRAEDVMVPNLRVFASLAESCGGELVLGADGQTVADKLGRLNLGRVVLVSICDQATESVFDYCIAECKGDYICRFDDDERPSPVMAAWLMAGGYRSQPHWRFARAHLWKTDRLHLIDLWPDYQTRVSQKHLAGGREELHASSPFGLGEIGPGAILHYKFLWRSFDERAAIADRYERIRPGYGRGYKFARFQMPECVYDPIKAEPFTDPA